ncbi:MAG: hypothetical protein AMXMBFR13_13260 [Phycisphaerae bacterium]
MKRWSSSTFLAQLALCGSLLLLAGCPSAGDFGDSGGTAVAGLVVEAGQGGSTVCTVPENREAVVARVLELVNQERTRRFLPPLTLNPTLTRVAEKHACDMIQRGYFAHVSPAAKGPGERAIEEGYVFLAIGENLAAGQTSPEQVMQEWMNSNEGHRENILQAQWKEIGIAVQSGGEYGVYWVQEFGHPPPTP